jgi:hypothetical protein
VVDRPAVDHRAGMQCSSYVQHYTLNPSGDDGALSGGCIGAIPVWKCAIRSLLSGNDRSGSSHSSISHVCEAVRHDPILIVATSVACPSAATKTGTPSFRGTALVV